MSLRPVLVSALLLTVGHIAPATAAPGSVTVTFTTHQTSDPRYAPRNVLAVWVEDEAGHFVKTLVHYASRRERYLRDWMSANTDRGAFGPDVITGATRTGHGERMASWDLLDHAGQPVPRGNYVIRMELTDNESGHNNEGQLPLVVNGQASEQTTADNGNFSGISATVTADTGSSSSDAGPSDSDAGPGEGCSAQLECVDGDGCCPLDCVYEVDSDCARDSAHAASGGSGCSTGQGSPGLIAVGFLALLGGLLRRSRT